MRAVTVMGPVALLVLLAGCQKPPAADTDETAAGSAPATAGSTDHGRWNADVVWQGSLSTCRSGSDAPTRECLRDAMAASGGSPAAIAAAEQLSSGGELAYVSAWHEQDGIGVATVTYPFRANTNEGTRLVDAANERITVDGDPLQAADDPAVQAIKQAHASAMPFPPAQQIAATPLAEGGVRLLYRTPLRECHACADVGHVDVAYDFDAERVFVGQQVQAPQAAP